MNIRRASMGSALNWSPSTGLGGRLRLDSPVAFTGMSEGSRRFRGKRPASWFNVVAERS